jgi:hypothetical protein
MNNQFGDHEGMIATNPSVLQGRDDVGAMIRLTPPEIASSEGLATPQPSTTGFPLGCLSL